MDDYNTSSAWRQAAREYSLKRIDEALLKSPDKLPEKPGLAAVLDYWHEVGEVPPPGWPVWLPVNKAGSLGLPHGYHLGQPIRVIDDGSGFPRYERLGDCHISGRSKKIPDTYPEIGTGVLASYENTLEVRKVGGQQRGGGLRGKIVGWSDGSRGRFIRWLNRVRWPSGKCYFVTLTFPDEFPSPKESKRLLRVLLKRIGRQYPLLAEAWRQELKRRKSGVNEGKIASHFHLFMWGITDGLTNFWSWLRDNWTEITGCSWEYGAHVREVNERKQACNYVMKYMEKSDDGGQTEAGRIWGHSANLDASPLWVIRLTRVQLAFLRKLVIAWAWAECQAIPSLIRFVGRLEYFSNWMGYSVYGMGETLAVSMLERVLSVTSVIGGMDGYIQETK